MARSILTLAAVATAAVPGLDVVAAGTPTHADPLFDQAIVSSPDGGRMLVRVPLSPAAEQQLDDDARALEALTTGVRTRLPFAVPTVRGTTRIGKTRAFVSGFLPGDPVVLSRLTGTDSLSPSIGRAIAAIHSLPTSVVADASLREERAPDALAASSALIERASATGLVPSALVTRWQQAAEDPALWQFAPTVVNGALEAGSVLHDGHDVTAVTGWQSFGVGDPAQDLAWLFATGPTAGAEAVVTEYARSGGSADRQLKKRAILYTELDVARWLLHGTSERSTEIVDDAVGMLHTLLDLVRTDLDRSIGTNTRPVMSVSEVERMLDETERAG